MEQPGQKRNQQREILDFLVAHILDRRFEVGQKIYSENFVAERLQVPRTAVHEVYTALEMMGVLESVHGGGTYLRAASFTNANPSLQLLMFLPTEEEEDAFLEFRHIVEFGMAERVVKTITEEEIDSLRKTLDRLKETEDPREASEMDVKLHRDFCRAGENPLISLIYDLAQVYITLISEAKWRKILASGRRSLYLEQIRQHERIVQALEARDVEACRRAVSNHLDTVERL